MPTVNDLAPETRTLIAELDSAVEAHMDWTRRVLRCVVLHASPGEDVLTPQAHSVCRFGSWYRSSRARFEALDPPAAQRIDAVHQAMHDAIRAICTDTLAARPGRAGDLDLFEQSQTELLGLLARFKTLILSNAMRHDPLTGLPLRYGLEIDFIHCLKDARRNGNLLYVVMIDIDRFKRINDRYGHPVGDRVLCHLADTLRSSLRGNEPLYRFGGEEFLWLMQCKTRDEAGQSAERLLATVRSTPVPVDDDTSVALTVTLGLALADERETLASTIERADQALYEGKNAGRDRYIIAGL